MKHQLKRRNFFTYIALTLVLSLVVTGSALVLINESGSAKAEGVMLTENTTIVQSPFTQAVQQVKDSVVGVNQYGIASPRGRGFFDPGFDYGYGGRGDENEGREVIQGAGSGVVVAKGYVLTNNHVVEGASSLEVEAGDETYKAILVGNDEVLDIAVLKVEGLDLEPVVLGDSDALNVGDWAICIGNPLSFMGTTTVGVISGLNREITSENRDVYGRRTESVNKMIQTDAAINAGNSGGGMFNVAGELVGIPSMKYTGSYFYGNTVEGIGMAIPINEVKPLLQSVMSGKSMVSSAGKEDDAITAENKPRIGVTITDLNASNPAVARGILPNGAYVAEVEKGSPAEKAGLLQGDIIVEVDGTIITSSSQMKEILQARSAGETAAVKIYRVEGLDDIQSYEDIPDGEYMDLSVELAMLDNVKQ